MEDSMPIPVQGAAAAATGNSLYIIGGRSATGEHRNNVQRFVMNGTWNEAFRMPRQMRQSRWAAAAVALDGGGSILVCGGSNTSGAVLNTCEKYDVANNTWRPFPPMERQRYVHVQCQ